MKTRPKTETSEQPKLVAEPNRVPLWVMPLVKGGILLMDMVLAFACFTYAFYLREGSPVFAEGTWAWSKAFEPYSGAVVFLVPVRILMLLYGRVYRLTGAFSYLDEFIKVLKAVSVGSLLLIAFTFLFRSGFVFRDFSYSRGVFALDLAMAIVVFSIFHLGLRYIQTLFRRHDINLIPTLIVGTNKEAEQTIRELHERPGLGYRVVGIVSSENIKEGNGKRGQNEIWSREFGTEIVGDLDALPTIIRDLAIQEVIITDSGIPSETLFEAMLKSGRTRNVEFRLVPKLVNFLPQKTTVEQIGILPMVSLFREPLSDSERFAKRISDIIICAFSIVLLSPLLFLVSLLIKADSRGGVLFKQERVGMDGRKFLCFKFRTMISAADNQLHREAYKKNIEGVSGANSGDRDNPVFGKVKNDPRVTKVGKFLRRSSFDELPQLLNVLLGDMSIVGPRPPIPYEVEKYDIWHRKRLDMKPGITGLWQVSGRNRLTFEEMVRIDLYYIENWSMWLDVKIVLLTLPAMLQGDGAK